MLGSVLGAVLGTLFGGGVTYYVQRRLEARRVHEEKIKELVPEMRRLMSMIAALRMQSELHNESNNRWKPKVFPEEVQDKAHDIELMATNLDDSELRDDILEALNKKYESQHEIFESLSDLLLRVEKEAYPAIHEVRSQHAIKVENLTKEGKDAVWAGPSRLQFVKKLQDEGALTKEEWERGK
jgi:hypothetical protein